MSGVLRVHDGLRAGGLGPGVLVRKILIGELKLC